MTKQYLTEYLKPFIGRIVIANQFDEWKNSREMFLYDGTLNNKKLRNILPNEVILEFDFSEEGKSSPGLAKKEAQRWHEKAVAYIKTLNIGFHITDHNGKSPHIRLQIYGLDILPDYVRSIYKERFVGGVLQHIRFDSKLILPDRGLLIKSNSLVSMELQPHFKPEHNNNIEQITYIHQKPLLLPKPQQIKDIEQSFKSEIKELPQTSVNDIDKEKLNIWFKAYYKEGVMNNIDLAFFGLCKKSGLSEQQAEQTYKNVIKKLNHDFDYKRKKRLESTYNCDNPAIYSYLDDVGDITNTKAEELYQCFKVYDKTLISAEDIINMDIPPIEWDIEGLTISNGYHFLGGQAGKFKTYLSFFMARSFITGEDFLGRKVKKRRVLLVDEESRERTLKERTIKVLSDLTPEQRHNFKYSISKGIKFDENYISQLEEDIKHSKAQVVIMDSFVRFFVGNENSADDVKKSFQLLKPLMEKYGCSFIIIHHFNKNNQNNKSAMDSLRGSSDLTAQCDTIMAINEDFKDNYSVWLEKNRHGEKGDKIKFRAIDSPDKRKLTLNFVGEISQIHESADSKNSRIFFDYLIREEFDVFSLNGHSETFKKKLGFSKNVLYKIRDVLLKEGKLLSEGKGFYKVVEDEFGEMKDE